MQLNHTSQCLFQDIKEKMRPKNDSPWFKNFMEFANALYKQDERYDGECFVLMAVVLGLYPCITKYHHHSSLFWNQEYCVCSRPWPFNLSFPVISLWPQLSKVLKLVAGPTASAFPAVVGCQLVIVRAAAYASDSGESLHCFLVGANKSYIIVTSDLWLFIHVSNLLPLLPTLLPYNLSLTLSLWPPPPPASFLSVFERSPLPPPPAVSPFI